MAVQCWSEMSAGTAIDTARSFEHARGFGIDRAQIFTRNDSARTALVSNHQRADRAQQHEPRSIANGTTRGDGNRVMGPEMRDRCVERRSAQVTGADEANQP